MKLTILSTQGENPVSLSYHVPQIPYENKDLNKKHTTKLPEENNNPIILEYGRL